VTAALIVLAATSPLYVSVGVLLVACWRYRSSARATARCLVDVTARADATARQLAEANARLASQDQRNEQLRKDNAWLARENKRKDQMLLTAWEDIRRHAATISDLAPLISTDLHFRMWTGEFDPTHFEPDREIGEAHE